MEGEDSFSGQPLASQVAAEFSVLTLGAWCAMCLIEKLTKMGSIFFRLGSILKDESEMWQFLLYAVNMF